MTGVYFLLYNKRVVYIGQTTKWPARMTQHKTIKFNEAKIFECDKRYLNAYEARLISLFNPRFNHRDSSKKINREHRDEWIVINSELIEEAIKANNFESLLKKVRRELKYSPRYTSPDLLTCLLSAHDRLNCNDFVKRKKIA